MIAGKLLNANSLNQIVVDAYKIQHFKSYSKNELDWPSEVIDINQRVYYKS